MTLEQARAFAASIGWLSEQPLEFRNRFLKSCQLRALNVGDKFYGFVDPPGGVFGLVDGFLDILLASGPSPPFLAFIARPGWWVGEAAAVTATERRVELRARTPAHALHLPIGKLNELANEDPTIWRELAKLTVSHMDNALMLASILAPGSVRSKVLATLHRLAGAMAGAEEVIELPCNQSEIAEMAGLTRNSVGPTMRELASEGLIVSSRGRIAYNPVRIQHAISGLN